jgi:cytochrome c-type biogenesis protein CcmH
MCPLCERPLNTVDREPQAQRERAFIQTLIDQCKSKEEIKTALAAQFGPDVLALPDEEGFDLTAYIVPVLVPLAALAAIALTATRWRRRRPGTPAAATAADTAPPSGPPLDPDESARLDEDLERYKL